MPSSVLGTRTERLPSSSATTSPRQARASAGAESLGAVGESSVPRRQRAGTLAAHASVLDARKPSLPVQQPRVWVAPHRGRGRPKKVK